MVRLRRELDGIRLDRAVPPPPWALDPAASHAVTPSWATLVAELAHGRVLFCGRPDLDLALAAADAGAKVTVCDLNPGQARRFVARLTPAQAGAVQVVTKVYGSATFTPSAFDTVVLADHLHAYEAPEWVVHKLQRELKVDGVCLARLWVTGPLGELPEDAPVGAAPAPWQAKAWQTLARPLRAMTSGPTAPLWWRGPALEARDRGVRRLDASLPVQLQAIADKLHVEQVRVGSTVRAEATALGVGAHGPLSAASFRAAAAWSELADDEDRLRTAGRVVIVQARRALMVGGRALRFG